MFNEDLSLTVKEAVGSGVAVDAILFVTLIILVFVLLSRNNVVFSIIVFALAMIFALNETLTTQEAVEHRVDNKVLQVSVDNSSSSPFKLRGKGKLLTCIPIIFSGVIQLINMYQGDRKYLLTKKLSTSLVANSVDKVVYRSYLSGPLPDKTMFVCQHLPYLFDTLVFHTFIPNTHKLSVFNDFTMGGMSPQVAAVFHTLYCKHLYGAYKFSRRNKEEMKVQLVEFVDSMMNGPEPEVYCIWPSGWAWDYSEPNGVKQFKAGTFYISAFTGYPMTIIHGRHSEDKTKFLVEQSDLIYPPTLDSKESSYMEFFNNPDNKVKVEEYRKRVESLYREIDNRLVKDANTI